MSDDALQCADAQLFFVKGTGTVVVVSAVRFCIGMAIVLTNTLESVDLQDPAHFIAGERP